MIVEHECVTTMEAREALKAASEFLEAGGFASGPAAFAVGESQWTTLDMSRGKTKGNVKNVAELPQRVLIHFDRGRLTIAASITANATWGGGSWGRGEVPAKMKLHRELLMAIVTGLERHVRQRAASQGEPPTRARWDWINVEKEIAEAARKRSRRLAIFAICLFSAVAGILILAWVVSSS